MTQATTPISTSTTTSPHPTAATPTPELTKSDKFERAKAKGNDHVRKVSLDAVNVIYFN